MPVPQRVLDAPEVVPSQQPRLMPELPLYKFHKFPIGRGVLLGGGAEQLVVEGEDVRLQAAPTDHYIDIDRLLKISILGTLIGSKPVLVNIYIRDGINNRDRGIETQPINSLQLIYMHNVVLFYECLIEMKLDKDNIPTRVVFTPLSKTTFNFKIRC